MIRATRPKSYLRWVNPLTPMSDQDGIFHYQINTTANRQVLRRNKNNYQLEDLIWKVFFVLVTSQLGSYTCNLRGSETPDCCLIHHRSDLKSFFFFVLTTSQLGSYTCNLRWSETPDCCLIHHMIISFTAWSQQMWILLWCRDSWKDLL